MLPVGCWFQADYLRRPGMHQLIGHIHPHPSSILHHIHYMHALYTRFICDMQVAASGGYLMAAQADTIVASPFAILGSIGV